MGVDAIYVTSKNFKVTKENLDKFMDEIDPEGDESFKSLLCGLGWSAKVSRKDGLKEVSREACGWIDQDEFDFFAKLAPYADEGGSIEIETIYGGAYYEKWVVEEGKLQYYSGEKEIVWTKSIPDYR